MMKKILLYSGLLLLLTCAKEDSQAPNNQPSTIVPKYTLTASAGEGGSVAPSTGSFNAGTQVSVTATPNSGYQFTSWSNGSTANPVTVTLNSNTSITANFEVLINSYTLTVVSTDGGSATGAGEYNEGTEVTLTATASEGYRFTGWSDGSSEESITITLNSDTALTANFELIPVYELIINIDEGGTVEGAGEYEEGTEVTITAIANGCYKFTEWSDGDVNNPRTISLDSDLNLTANFESLMNEHVYSLVRIRYPCARLINNDKPYNETEKYIVGPSGWLSIAVLEQYEGYYYPTNTDYNPPGYYYIDPHNMTLGDFNNDGLQDVLVTWATFTHTLERESRLTYSILLNNGDGSMTIDNDAFTSNSIHYNHFAYRTKIADFNGDGYDDIISASMGVIQRLPGQNPYTRWERIPLLFNTGDGKFYDASTNIEGQEDGVSPPEGHSFGHELAVGDVDGDGDNDIFTGKILLINDGTGNFSNKTNLLIDELKPNGRNLWSSVIADFNNDGIDDFFVPYAETTGASWERYTDFSGVYSISKNGNPSYNNSVKGFVSETKYGISNTKFNYAIDYDINLDGFKDVIIAVTRASPYYIGKGLQVFLNVEDPSTGSRKFISGDHLLPDETSLDQFQGEGQLTIIDINNDGILDVAHTGGTFNSHGLSFYINNGGSLQLLDLNQMAYLNSEQIPERSNWPKDGRTLGRAFPVDLNGSGWIDYISILSLGSLDNPSEQVFYSVLSKD